MKWIVSLCALVCLGCQTREIGGGEAAVMRLMFSDDFERAELGETWKRGTGEGGQGHWSIKNGWLAGDRIKNDPLWFRQPLPDKVRVEFDARARTADGDLKFEIFGDGDRHESGYIVIFGGWKNALDVIARLDEHGEDRLEQASFKVEHERIYRVAAERTDSTLRVFVDGKELMRFEDSSPLLGSKHQYFAFNNWLAAVEFDNFKVYELE